MELFFLLCMLLFLLVVIWKHISHTNYLLFFSFFFLRSCTRAPEEMLEFFLLGFAVIGLTLVFIFAQCFVARDLTRTFDEFDIGFVVLVLTLGFLL